MKVQELRVGNYLLKNGNMVVLYANTILEVSLNPKEYDPILLSESVLLSCGFVRESDGIEFVIGLPLGSGCDLILENVINDFKLPLDVVIRRDKNSMEAHNPFIYLKPIQHLHQLQNLYFALTDNELEVKM